MSTAGAPGIGTPEPPRVLGNLDLPGPDVTPGIPGAAQANPAQKKLQAAQVLTAPSLHLISLQPPVFTLSLVDLCE